MTTFAVPIVVRDFEFTAFGSEKAVQIAIDSVASAQVVSQRRANKVFVVRAENERAAELIVKSYCKDHDVHALRIDRPIEAEAL